MQPSIQSMALFQFRSSQVGDPAAQQNFEQLEGMFPIVGKNVADGTITSQQIADGTIAPADLATLPQVRAYNNANLSLANITDTPLTLNSERWDLGTTTEQHSVTVNTSRLTCQVAGLYKITANAAFAANATGERRLYIRLNGVTKIGYQLVAPVATAGVQTVVEASTEHRLIVGDYVEAVGFQSSGVALNVEALGNFSPEFMMSWIGP